jgi:hypothetical protein
MEQNLLQELVAESIKVNGIDVYYIPRTTVSKDEIYTEDVLKEYNNSYLVDVYVKSFDGFEGEGQFLQKFNLEIRDSITFSISTRTFENEVGQLEMLDRPNEGDLIYFPQGQRLFQIQYVEKFSMFLPLGTIPSYDLKCEMFEYSNEILNTGIEAVDNIAKVYSLAMNIEAITLEDGMELKDEDGYSLMLESWDIDTSDATFQNDEIETYADNFIDFSELNPFSEDGTV